jgi:hypothetical protein
MGWSYTYQIVSLALSFALGGGFLFVGADAKQAERSDILARRLVLPPDPPFYLGRLKLPREEAVNT